MSEVVDEWPIHPCPFVELLIGKVADAWVFGRQAVVQLPEDVWRGAVLVYERVERATPLQYCPVRVV